MAVLRYFHQDPRQTSVQESSVIDKQGTVLTQKLTTINQSITNNTQVLEDKLNSVPGKSLSTNDFTDEYKNKLRGIEEGAEVNVQSDWGEDDNTADSYIKNKPVIDDIVTQNSENLITSGAVFTAIDELPEPMIFKGSLGVGGTIQTLPAPSADNVGFVYKVITAGAYYGITAKPGDSFISDSSDWILIPSGDEPEGTVMSVGLSVPTGLLVSGSPITTSGTLAITYALGYAIPTTAKQDEWDAKQNAISDLSTIRSNASNGNTAYGWGNHANAGYQAAISDLATIRSNASEGHTAYGWGNHANAGYLTGITKAMVTTALGYTPPLQDTNTTYSIATGDSNGQIKVTPSSGNAYNVSVKGLGSRAYDSTSYLPLAGGTMTGNISFSNSGTGFRGINYGTMGDNDQWRIGGAATGSNAGYMEIATADDGNEPIYVRLYTGVFSTVKRTLTLLDANGYSIFPSYINIGGHEKNASSPPYVWGSNSSDNYLRSYQTSSLSVNYATSSGDANTVDGYHASGLVKITGDKKFTQYQNGYWSRLVTFKGDSRWAGSLTFRWYPDEVTRTVWCDINVTVRDKSVSSIVFYHGTSTRTFKVVGDGNLTTPTASVWVYGDKLNYGPSPLLLLLSTYAISSYDFTTLYLDTEPSGTVNVTPVLGGYVASADYANSAGSVEWTNVSHRPTNLNLFTNGPGYITGITKTMVTTALGYTPPTSDTNNAVTLTNTATTNANYRVLMSVTADDTTRTEGARKSTNLLFNPSVGRLFVALSIRNTDVHNRSGGWNTYELERGISVYDCTGSSDRGAPSNYYATGLHVGGQYWFLLAFERGDNSLKFRGGNAEGVNKSWTRLLEVSSSDIRLKDIQEEYSPTVEEIAEAPLFKFKWKEGEDKNIHVGTSAQYWQQHMPEVVIEEKDEMKTLCMKYDILGAVNSIAIAKEVVSLKEEIKLLQALIAELKLLLNN